MAAASSASRDRKRKILTLEQRLEVIKQLDSGKSCRKVAEDFGCGKTQIARCKTERVDILKEWESGSRSDLKYVKKRKTVYDVVNSLTWEWFCKKRSQDIPISGVMIQVNIYKLMSDNVILL